MGSFNDSRYRRYKMYFGGIRSHAEVTVDGSRGWITVTPGKIPETCLAFGDRFLAFWLSRSGDEAAVFLVGAQPFKGTGPAVLHRGFYPYNVAGTGKIIEEFDELLVTVERSIRPATPAKTLLYRQPIGCFSGRPASPNPIFYEVQPFDPPLQNYRWWGIVGNLCTAEDEPGYPVNCREEGRC